MTQAEFEKKYVNKIICGDCLEVMKDWPDNCVDLVLTDPPYGVNFQYDIYEDSATQWLYQMSRFIPLAKRLATMFIMPSCQIKKLPIIYERFPPDWLICWHKGSCEISAYIGFNDWEPLLVYGKRKDFWIHDFIYAQPERTPKNLREHQHPCPKPLSWAYQLVERCSKKADLILDPFCGSGTTCVAAKLLGRRYIGIDISPDYCKIAEERLRAVDTGVPVKEARTGQIGLFEI